jgi:hypothetical protein
MRVIGEREILELVEPRFSSAELAREWYERAPLPGFSEKTAAQLVQNGSGKEVARFIKAVDAGIHA